MIYLFTTVHIIICLFLILVVLLQQGKGADLSVFGGGGTQTVFGARGAATILHKLTVGGFIAFIITTVAIGLLNTSGLQSSVMSDVPPQEEAAPAPVAPPVPDAPAVDPAGSAAEDSTALETGEANTEEVGSEEPAGAGEAESPAPEPPTQ